MKGQKIVVTGGNYGIGFETAKKLYEDGHHIIIGSRNEERNKEAINKISAGKGGSIKSFSFDLSIKKSVEEFADFVKKEFNNEFDILVNNSGAIMDTIKFSSMNLEMTMAVNHFGPFYLTYLLL